MQKNIIAIFGGSFNPPTIAHIDLAKQILDNIENIEKIIFVPVSTKYNKQGLASDNDRFNMLEEVCKKLNNIEVSSIELDSPRQLFTIETLDILQEQNKEKQICFIIGTDNLKQLETWHKADELLKKYKVIVLKRNNDNVKEIIRESVFLSKYKASIINLENIKPINLSSSYIRERLEKSEGISSLVPREILEEVKKLYSK